MTAARSVGVAAVVAAISVTGLVLADADDDRLPEPSPERAQNVPVERHTKDWRTEHWRDLSVEVPAAWGYGGAPHESGGSLVSCFPAAMVGPDGAQLEDEPALGYVGRPIGLTDVCATYPDNRPGEPAAPYVWLGASVPVGVVELGGGFVQETVEAHGSTLTVGSDDPGLRERILQSAEGGERCLSELEEPPTVRPEGGPGGPAQGVTVCAYHRDQDGLIGLTFSTVVGTGAAEAFEEAFGRGRPVPVGRACDLGSDDSWVVLSWEHRTYVVSPQGRGCPQAAGSQDPSALPVTLTREMARPWAVAGIPAVVAASPGPDQQWMYELFIGPQG